MASLYSPKFVTETNETPPWTDCTWASGLMLANKASGGKYPSTRAEREALRNASGDHVGGSNLRNLKDGIAERYHWDLILDSPSFTILLTRLKRGDGAVAQGLYNRLTEHFQRWDQNFANKPFPAHATYIQGHDRAGNFHLDGNGVIKDVFWNDPLGRSPANTPASEQYRGEWMPVGILLNFVTGLAPSGDLLVATVQNRSV